MPASSLPTSSLSSSSLSASSRTRTGVALFALLAVLDISWLIQAWFGLLSPRDAPPTGVLLAFALVGVVTLATVQPAQHGNRGAARVMVGSRVVSVLLADLPSYALGAPPWVLVIASVAIVLTVLGIWWTAPLLRRAGATSAATRAMS
jgi:hypothetical protein